MADNQRKLMPYEHQLVEALGITKEEYIDFVAKQQLYTDVKQGTALDIRNDFGVVALVLTIIGTILQVAAALLAEKSRGQRTQTRDDIFAPRSGFNSIQELGEYGDPINLVYANTVSNPNGGVRIATTLLWSAVKSYGSSQYIQLLLLLGAGEIGRIDPARGAFGQTPLRDLISQNYWLYFKPNGTGGLRRNNLLQGENGKRDPGTIGADKNAIYRIDPTADSDRGDGFSHAISPSTSNRFGVYAPVPINVLLESRFESGNITRANNQIKARELGAWGENTPNRASRRIRKGDKLKITLRDTNKKFDRIAEEEAAEFRRTVSTAFDNAGIMKLGSAKFAIDSINNGSTDDGDMVVSLTCIESGHAPSIIYSATDPQESAAKIANNDPEFQELRKQTERLLDEDERSFVGRLGIFTIRGSFIPNSTLLGDSPESALLEDGRIFIRKTYTSFNPKTGRSTRVRYEFKRKLTQQEKTILRDYIAYEKAIEAGTRADDTFFSKALVKIETAHYETLSPCHIVDFAIKARVWRRISGRQERYGSNRQKGYPSTDNGLKRRSAMFLVKYKKQGDSGFTYVRGIFVVRRASDVDNFVYFRFNSGRRGLANADHWQFEIEPVHDTIAEFNSHPLATENGAFRFFYLENSGKEQRIGLPGPAFISFTGRIRASSTKLPPLNRSPRDTNEWDLFSNTADTQLQMSFDQGPEFTITAVTEQIAESFSLFKGLYQDLSLVGFNMYSGRNVQDLRSLSMFVEQGRRSRLLRTKGTVNGIAWGDESFEYLPPRTEITSSQLISGTSYYITSLGNTNWREAGWRSRDTGNSEPTVGDVFEAKKAVTGTGRVRAGGYANNAPDIFLDTVLDANDGIGKYSGGVASVDMKQLAESKKFCERNKLFMDGAIAEPGSWRQFWANNAPFSLLELVKTEGREALAPALPYEPSSGRILDESLGAAGKVKISALFNQGNILEESYKEEFIDYGNSTEDVIITLIYRDNERGGVFPKKNSVEVRLSRDENGAAVDEDSLIRETIDLSAFVTNREQAILVGKFLCQTRRHSRRAIEFKTFPTDSPVGPGAYIYVELGQNQWSNIHSGSIGEDGELNLPLTSSVKNGSYQVLMYNPNDQSKGTVFRPDVTVVNNTAASLKGFTGYVFVLGRTIRNKRVFRITEVAMDEEGEVTIKAVEHAVDSDGYSRITKGLARRVAGLFTIDGSPE
jgi:hypothetical protein